ncbi:biotin/lipoate A/B protein ligase family protein [Virgibacillus kekensis]|uniref:Biotin/lipoate A/B protein ligase family protein n=1 Tax=Virgibacillus kekensis TaxID=202261 RepID=A0ABV9DHK9_9BACI
MKETWGFIDTGFNSASVNMALDEKLLDWHGEGKIPPTLRFYGWSKPSLSVGHFQNAERAIDFSNMQKHECEFVRRLTGGSAVLHDDELTYSIVVSEDKDYIPTSIQAAYYVLSKGVLEGYKQLGIEADYATPEKKAERTDVCFEKPAFYEMLVNGKKVSGNAQTRKQGVLLQHGSIPMSMNTTMLFDLFKFPNEKIREKKRNTFSEKAITINEITRKQHTYDDLKDAFQKGFKEELNLEFTPLKLSDSQWSEVYELAKSKYTQEEWNLYHQRSV